MTAKTANHNKSVATLRHDIDAIKEDVSTLANHALEAGVKNASMLTEQAVDRFEDLKETSLKSYERVEKRIREKPGQSMAIAFAGGVLLSMLLGRK